MHLLASPELTFLFYYYRDCESRLQQTGNMNLYHVTKFSLNLSLTVLYFSKKTVVSRYFHPLEFFLAVVSAYFLLNLTFTVNVTLNLSIIRTGFATLETEFLSLFPVTVPEVISATLF